MEQFIIPFLTDTRMLLVFFPQNSSTSKKFVSLQKPNKEGKDIASYISVLEIRIKSKKKI